MSVLYDVIHSGIAGFMRWPHVDVMHGALFFVYWYKTLCHCLGIRDSLVVDDVYDDADAWIRAQPALWDKLDNSNAVLRP